MICSSCQNIIVLHGFSFDNCKSCGDEVVTSHTPGYKLCDKCSEDQKKCQQCSGEMPERSIGTVC